eukprot:6208986-Pleurochrysis_carterae.AAC.2
MGTTLAVAPLHHARTRLPYRATSTAMATAAAAACASEACTRARAMEPLMPVVSFMDTLKNPCIATSGRPQCLPFVHVISGWHMFSDEALGFLKGVKEIDVRNGGCFDDWADDQGAADWVTKWGGPPPNDGLILAHCNKLLTWYPAFAGRYTSAWGKSYGPCKERELHNGPGDYYQSRMWPICRKGALAAHDEAMGTGGTGHEATPPFVMAAQYGPRVRVISALRNPVDRLETSFWIHRHYQSHYGRSPQGLHAYIREQTEAFDRCSSAYSTRRCAFLFELLEPQFSDVFFHCDQIIRGLYEPFVRDWHGALGSTGLL